MDVLSIHGNSRTDQQSKIGEGMTEQNYAYWLQGFFEITKPESITAEQVIIMKNHIKLVKKCWEPRKESDVLDLPPLDNMNDESIPAINDGDIFANNGLGHGTFRC